MSRFGMLAGRAAAGLIAAVAAVAAMACARGEGSSATNHDNDAGAFQLPDAPFDEDVQFHDGCGLLEVKYTKRVPSVVVLIDLSGSMDAAFGATTRYRAVRDALVGEPGGVLPLIDGEMRVGASLFNSNGGFADVCPQLFPASPVIDLHTTSTIRALLDAHTPWGDTPTGESIDAVAARLAAFSPPEPPCPPSSICKYIVLATDGEPDTCGHPNGFSDLARQVSIEAVQRAFQKRGIATFVIGVGSDVGVPHLQDLANAGAGLDLKAPVPAKYYQALDGASVLGAFHEIVEGVRSCSYTLDGKVKDGRGATVKIDGGDPLVFDDPNGFRLDDGGHELILLGAACARIKTGYPTLEILVRCGDVAR